MDSKKDFAVVNTSKTADGSDTLYSSVFDAHYHSSHGAKQESNHVFIQEGLNHYSRLHSKNTISILEIGMGTGLNVLLTLLCSDAPQVYYTTIEGYPISPELSKELNYAGNTQEQAYFDLIHESPWEEWINLNESFKLYKNHSLFEEVDYKEQYDIVYFDAFAPSTQPHLWTTDLLSSIVTAMNPGGILVTFCAQGAFKRELKSLNLEVERVPGPPGKREMTRAVKKQFS
ncbi:MAG: tRNA U34 5-methylaminomethyl-2-thiouridine-forming methyltransferase MnmC [Saprospiraceae bacterium]